jgi:hypothetical protein
MTINLEQHQLMSADYGNQIYKTGQSNTEDPEKNYRYVARLGNDDTQGYLRFVVPDDKSPLKADQLLFLLTFEIPSNYVPDNDMHAKMIRELEVKMLSSTLFHTYDDYQYFLLNHFLTKLNFSNLAQDTELFYRGRFDHYDCHSDALESTVVKYNGLNLIENRRQYASKVWIKETTPINFGNFENVYPEALSYTYNFKCPIAHGLTRQPKVIPAGSELEFDITFHASKYMLMKPSEYREYRLPRKIGDVELTAKDVKWSMNSEFLLETTPKWHLKSETDETSLNYCICAYDKDGKTVTNSGSKDGKDKPIKQLEYDARLYENHIILGDKTADYFKPDGVIDQDHIAQMWFPKIKYTTGTDNYGREVEYVHFWKKYSLPDDTPARVGESSSDAKRGYDSMMALVKNIQLESVFCDATKKNRPISLGSSKVKLPLYYPKLQIETLRVGLQTYPLNLHMSGPLPYMIVLSGRSHNSTKNPTFEKCVTQTSLKEPGFEIEEISIFLNSKRILRTPWTHGLDHYVNFIKHTGRYDNSSLGGSTDYFHFLQQNWMIPINLGEYEGMHGQVTAEIIFKNRITDAENLWDAYIMKIPSANLILDGRNNGKFII